jgi:uncharacterized repeat protein (TIGR01451 family)
MEHKRGQISSWARGACAAITVLLLLFVPGLAQAQGPGSWEEYSSNPIIGPLVEADGLYPTVLYDPSPTPFGGHGEANSFKMWHNLNLQYRVSDDGISWTKVGDMLDGTITGLPAGRVSHPLVEYFADGFPGRNDGTNTSDDTMYYRLWFWHTGYLYTVSSTHYAESPDGKAWYNVQPLQNGAVPIVTGVYGDWNRGSYGPCDVLYDPGASNSGTDWTFRLYYDGTTGGDEAIGLGFSADGVTWTGYDAGGDGQADAVMNGTYVVGDWDYNYVSRATVWREGPGDYRMWYSAGPGEMRQGIGYAISPDGLTWTRDPNNPIFHKDDTGYPGYPWRQDWSYTPMVLRAGNLWFMWYSGHDLDAPSMQSIGLAYASAGLPGPLVEIEKSVHPAEITVGEETLFTISVTNVSLDAVDGVVVTDEIDPGLEIVDVQTSNGSIARNGQLVTVDVGTMAPDETVVITIRVLAEEAGLVQNLATVTTPSAVADAEAVLNVVAIAEEEFVPEAGSLILLGSGLASMAGFASLRRRRTR